MSKTRGAVDKRAAKPSIHKLPLAQEPITPRPDGCMYLIWRKAASALVASQTVGGMKHKRDAIREAKRICKELLELEIVYVQEVPDFDFSGPMRNVWFGRGRVPINS